MSMLKRVEVVAAVIRNGDRIFATQRGYGKFKDYWEFPGGKIEPGETPEAALKREIEEELATEVEVNEYVGTVDYDYPDFHITLHFYNCKVLSGNLELLEHESAKWLPAAQLDTVNWLPADYEILPKIKGEVLGGMA
jgi:8-oxo-dGTP diphosphatase